MPSTQAVVLAELKACLSPEFWIRGERMDDFVHAALGDRLSQDAVRVKLHGNGKRGKGSGMIAISPLQSQGIDRKRAEGEKVNWYWGPLTSSGSAPSVGCNEYNSLHEYIGGQDLAEEIWLAGSPTEGGRSASRGGEGDEGSDEGGEDQW